MPTDIYETLNIKDLIKRNIDSMASEPNLESQSEIPLNATRTDDDVEDEIKSFNNQRSLAQEMVTINIFNARSKIIV